MFGQKRRTEALDIHTIQHVRPAEYVISVKHGDAMALMNVATGHYYTIDGVGVSIWVAMNDSTLLAEIISSIQYQYGISQSRTEADLAAFLTQLVDADLVHLEVQAP
jgi:hypothetical protein